MPFSARVPKTKIVWDFYIFLISQTEREREKYTILIRRVEFMGIVKKKVTSYFAGLPHSALKFFSLPSSKPTDTQPMG